jgi:hypothetical protein
MQTALTRPMFDNNRWLGKLTARKTVMPLTASTRLPAFHYCAHGRRDDREWRLVPIILQRGHALGSSGELLQSQPVQDARG